MIIEIACQVPTRVTYIIVVRATIERWHWDEPETTLTWTDIEPDYISRNIRFYIELPSIRRGHNSRLLHHETSYLFATEANAWLDKDSETGEVRVEGGSIN